MRAQLSNRDYEQLSAYIDGQLAQSERRRLEERIHNQPELQNALDELTQTRALIRQAPRRHAPRNFTLTPEMIGEANLRHKRSRGWNFNLFPILSFTSALAALALVAVLIFQLLPGAQKTGLATAQQPAMAPQAAQDTASAESARNAGGATGAAGGAVGAAPMTKSAAEPTQAAALRAAEPTLAPEGTQGPNAAGAAPAAAAPAATEPAAIMQAPSGAAAKAADSAAGSVPPVVAWNGAPPFGAQATGMGGGGGGDGSGPGPQQGALLGPPAANDTYGSVPSGQQVGGMGGGGVVNPNAVLSVPLNLPSESVNSLENNAAARAANPPASVNNTIQGAGPILGVAQAGQGGQIIEQRSLVGSPDGVTPQATTQPGESATPGNQLFIPGLSNDPAQGSEQPAPTSPGGVSLPVIEGLLALIALISGGAAFYLRRRKR